MPPKQNTAGDPISRYRDFKEARPQKVGMLVEGDSWFAFPMMLRTNITNELKKAFRNKIVQLPAAKSGADAREILSGKQYAYLYQVLAEERLNFDCILFSGGGNDIVDVNLPVLLKAYKTGDSWEDCLHMPRFRRRLAELEYAYEDLADLRDDYQPEAWIFTHGYDYAMPSGDAIHFLGLELAGGWIKEQMDDKEIPPGHQKQILNYMLAEFDNLLIRLEQSHPRWRHVRTQGTLKDKDWGDEMHPTTEGFQKITAKFVEALRDVFPQL